MKLLNYILYISILISLLACDTGKGSDPKPTDPPVSGFEYNAQSMVAPALISFQNKSTNATSYLWTFGTGKDSSTLENPVFTFTKAGNYTVTLTAKNTKGTNKSTQNFAILDTATKVSITKITVKNMSFFDPSGSGWDSNDGPDLYYAILGDNNLPIKEKSKLDIKTDIDPNKLPAQWSLSSPFTLTDLSKKIYIQILDYDPIESDDIISSVEFVMSDYIKGALIFPTSIKKTYLGCEVELSLAWSK